MIKGISEINRRNFDKAAKHPLQSWAWGEFRKKTGVGLSRFGFGKKSIEDVFQITWHRIPYTKFCIGYCPKSIIPNKEEVTMIKAEAEKRGAIFVKFEPNEKINTETEKKIIALEKEFNFVKGKPLFTKYTFQLDISKSEEELLKNMHQKTRYNLRLAEKRGVEIIEDSSEVGFEDYWKLMEETTKRQGFFAHGKEYHCKMWQTMTESGMGHLFKAVYEGKTLTAWMVFILNDTIYYPYGASSNENREVMASNLMMWEVIRYGKKQGCRLFDMWGSLGPTPDIKDPWYGFHKFKQGYGAELVEFLGSFDLVVKPTLYKLYGLTDRLRWVGLKLLAGLRK
ncbi:MAG: FemAB family protein [Candidatus Collierbacteria bacterium GW2011_GWB2_42_12]|nr:MAG: FemAB family protein [Candidatus Collierbacteria bacterium GW2011_GWB2_42_12]